jgi:hypothetical protein
MSLLDVQEEFLRRAVECEHQAKQERDSAGRRPWLQMAERWRRCAQTSAINSSAVIGRRSHRASVG